MININTEKKLNKYTALNVIKLKCFIFSNAVKFIKADIEEIIKLTLPLYWYIGDAYLFIILLYTFFKIKH